MSLNPYKISRSCGATGFEIAWGPADPLVKGVGTKRFGKGRVKLVFEQINTKI